MTKIDIVLAFMTVMFSWGNRQENDQQAKSLQILISAMKLFDGIKPTPVIAMKKSLFRKRLF